MLTFVGIVARALDSCFDHVPGALLLAYLRQDTAHTFAEHDLVFKIKRLIPGWNSSSVCESGTQTKLGRLSLDTTIGANITMPMDLGEIDQLIKKALPDAQVQIKDLAGDGDHYAAHVVSAQFVGKSRVQQHRMVFDALGGRMGDALHALALTTAVPD